MKFTTYLGEEEIVAVVVYSFTPEIKAKVFGLPEDCYPPEAAEIKIKLVSVKGFDYLPLLSAEIKEQIEEQALNHAVNSAIDEAEQRADFERSQREEY